LFIFATLSRSLVTLFLYMAERIRKTRLVETESEDEDDTDGILFVIILSFFHCYH